MNLYVGTSGYAYKEWKGPFYPKDVPSSGFLRYYGEHFRAVEINNSFYRIPKPEVLKAWAAEVPSEFRFVLKASQRLTHFKRLKDCAEILDYFISVATTLEQRLGPIFFQLPPNLKRDIPRLRDFLALIPDGIRTVFEFRNQSWFDDETYTTLRERNAALCIAEADNGLDVPVTPTADFGYLRLRLPDYSAAALKSWLKKVRDQSWKDAFIFFMHEDEGNGPRLAKQLLEIAQ